jgi:propionyl-CoA carboxylase beta chain
LPRGAKEYEDRFLSPFIAERGIFDDVIMPHSTRKRIAPLAMLRDRKVGTPAKKHDNLPL